VTKVCIHVEMDSLIYGFSNVDHYCTTYIFENLQNGLEFHVYGTIFKHGKNIHNAFGKTNSINIVARLQRFLIKNALQCNWYGGLHFLSMVGLGMRSLRIAKM